MTETSEPRKAPQAAAAAATTTTSCSTTCHTMAFDFHSLTIFLISFSIYCSTQVPTPHKCPCCLLTLLMQHQTIHGGDSGELIVAGGTAAKLCLISDFLPSLHPGHPAPSWLPSAHGEASRGGSRCRAHSLPSRFWGISCFHGSPAACQQVVSSLRPSRRHLISLDSQGCSAVGPVLGSFSSSHLQHCETTRYRYHQETSH